MADQIASLFAKVSADVGDFNKGMGQVRDGLTSGESAVTKFGDVAAAAFKVVAVAVVAVGAAVGAMVGSSLIAAADMEQGIADIGAMMTLTTDETDKLKEHILDLGLDPNLKVSATEASEAVMALGTAGLSLTQIMGGASEATVLLANATGGQFGDAANIATDVMAQFNIKAEDMNAAVNQIAGTTVASKFTIDDYRLAIAQAGGVAGTVGVSFEDFNAIIAATSPSFASGSDAGTSFKTMLQRLVPSTDGAREAMASLGLITADGGSKFFDATGKMKSAEEVAGLLQGAFGGLSDAQKISAASTIFGTDAMRTALALAESGTPIITKMKKEIGNVDAEELASKRMNTLKGSWEIFLGVVDTLKITIGDKFLPIARKLVDWTTELAQRAGPPVIAWIEKLTAKIEPAMKATDDWAKRVLPPLWDNLKKVWDVTVSLTKSVTEAIKPVTDAIGKYVDWKTILAAVAVLMAGPVLAAIGGLIAGLFSFAAPIAAVIAAVAALRFAWENDFMGIKTFTQGVLKQISDWFFKESGLWKGNWTDTWEYIVQRADRLIRIDLYNLIIGTWAQIKFETSQFVIKTRDMLMDWGVKLTDFFNHWVDVAGYTFRHTRDLILQYWHEWTDPTIKAITDWSARTVSQINTWVQYWKDKLTPWYEWVVGKFQGLFDWWDEHIQPWIDTGRQIVQGLWNGIKEKWEQFTTWWQGVWTGTVDWVKNLLGIASPSKVFESIGANLMAGLTVGIDGAKQAPLNAIESLTNQVKTKMDGMVDKVANSAQTIRDQINNMPALPNGYWSTPTGPTTPVTPVTPVPVPVTPPPPSDQGPPVVQHGGVDFGAKTLANGLNSIAAFMDTSDFVTDMRDFANSVSQLLTTGGQTLASSSAEAQAIRDINSGGIEGRRVNDVLNAVQLLIAELRERGISNTLNLNLSPDTSLPQQQELSELIAYYNALYA